MLQVAAALQALPGRLEAAREQGYAEREGKRRYVVIDVVPKRALKSARRADGPLSCAAMATCLVTGGAGFLGSHLCDELLRRGHRVICVDNVETGSLANIEHIRVPEFRFLQADII